MDHDIHHLALVQSAWPERLIEFYNGLPKLLFILERPPVWFGYGVGVLWTLQYEIVFYLLAALTAMAFGPRVGVLAFSLVCLSLGAMGLIYLRPSNLGTGLSKSLFWCAHFSFGSLLAYLWHTDRLKTLKNRRSILFLLPLIVFAGLWGVKPSPSTKYTASFIAALAGAVLISGFLLCSNNYPKFFGLPQFVGRISYSIYLTPAIMIDFGTHVLAWQIRDFVAYFLIVLSLSYATYSLVEKPGIWVGNWVTRKIF